ncbi:hypothetical protein HMPREF9265_0139 [Limosilactobacillus oris PB013-T2-3]|uniref:Uncharacterized protein n=1 Tax=Limosilactobacillus oris PB013-T2-3 TaxID=908339 RepID=E3C5H5_9LACO|nr:hypothetical protein HMPREF9265_0139 [Limosilactobacillus oris PB013-T2-3]
MPKVLLSSRSFFAFRLGGRPITKAFSFEIKPLDDKIYITIIILMRSDV